MIREYKALLSGNTLEWLTNAPEQSSDHPLHVLVSVEEKKHESHNVLDLLEKIAETNVFSEIDDPVQWQKNLRKDRHIIE